MTEPEVAMVAAMIGKVEPDQRVTEKRSRTGENRTVGLNLTELILLVVIVGREKESCR